MVEKKSNKNTVLFLVIIALVVVYLLFNLITSIDINGNTIAIIPIKGEISGQGPSQGFFLTGPSASKIVENIRRADEDPSISGIYLEIDSPGGTPVASHEIVKAVKRTQKPTVAVIKDIGASGAYWVASAADHVIVDELSLTGSVGVQGSYLGFYGLMDIYNVTYERIAGGEYKDLGTPFREMTDFEKSALASKVDQMHEFFLNDVAESRNLSPEAYEEVKSGIFFIGLEAYELGLADELGGDIEAINYFEELLNTSVRTRKFEETPSLFGSLWGISQDQDNKLLLK